MCEVTKKNFEEIYPKIKRDLHSATFIAIDCEFSGLFDGYFENSLFDTPKERFKKLQQILKNYAIIQMGLSTFQYEKSTNKFITSSYCFYILPSELLREKSKFTCEINSINFLCKHNFNFNKLFYEGISYISNSDIEKALKIFEEENFNFKSDKLDIQEYCSVVGCWLETALEGSEYYMEVKNFTFSLVYGLHRHIRKRFSNVWTFYENSYTIRIKKISKSEYKKLTLNENEKVTLKENFIDSLLGFLRIIKEIENCKKPIVGHNCLVDFIMIYKQFYDSSNVSYKTFKQNLNKLFPILYDTKVMSFRLKNILLKSELCPNYNSLSDLYCYFKDGKGANLLIFTPLIEHTEEKSLECRNFHDASFDSYCTGFVFINMAHMYSLWSNEKKTFLLSLMPTTSSWLLGAVTSMKNHLNISKSQVYYIVTDGSDPKTSRPGLLYIKSTKKQPLNIDQILDATAKFGEVDIKLINKYRGIIAVKNKKQEECIIKCFRDHKNLKISHYSRIKHSYWGQAMVTGGILAATFVLSYCVFKKQMQIKFFRL